MSRLNKISSSSSQMLLLTHHIFLILLLLLHIITRTEAKVPAIIVFGDSSVDSGNNNQISTILKGNFQPYGRDFVGKKPTGRFCNGRLPTDFISEAFGLKPVIPAYLDPMYGISDFATGVCFASAGTGYDNATSSLFNVISLWKEVEYYKDYQRRLRAYLGNDKANKIITEALYCISLGTNDFLENYFLPTSTRRFHFTVGQFQDFLLGIAQNFIRELYGLGVRKISITGVPPMGCLPLEITTNIMEGHACVDYYNDVALEFNNKLANVVVKLNKELPGINIVFSNAYPIFLQIIENPSSFGFDTATKACCGTGMFEMGYLCDKFSPFTCKDANKFVFWDAFHLTERTNRIISDNLLPRLLAQFL